ncbi:MAG: DUF433 domain-containing protein [Chloroflexota bacterium]
MAEVAAPQGLPALDKFRLGKAYTVAQAARLAGTTPATVRRWLVGYEAIGHRMAPVFGTRGRRHEENLLQVSFLELVEIVVVARFRQGIGGRPVRLGRLRDAHAYARDVFGLTYPFASLNLRESGGHVMHEFDVGNPNGPRLALSLHGQWELPGLVRTELQHFDFDHERRPADPFALRWFPRGRQVPIVVDPYVAAGRPTIYQRGVTIDTIVQRFRAGERIGDIAEDYELAIDLVEVAIGYAA